MFLSPSARRWKASLSGLRLASSLKYASSDSWRWGSPHSSHHQRATWGMASGRSERGTKSNWSLSFDESIVIEGAACVAAERLSSPAGGARGAVNTESATCPAGQVQRLVRPAPDPGERRQATAGLAPCTGGRRHPTSPPPPAPPRAPAQRPPRPAPPNPAARGGDP